MRGALLLLLVAGCCDPPRPQIAPDLADCRAGPHTPAVPRPPRTLSVIVAWGNANAAALARTQAALAECRARLAEVVRSVEEQADR